MQGLQIRIGAIKRVAIAIAGEVGGGWTVMLAHDPIRESVRISALIDVIAKEDHEVGILLGHVPVSAEVSRLPVRTRGEGKPHTLRLCARCWGGLGAAYRALLTQCREAIPMGAPRLEAAHLHMHRMRKPASTCRPIHPTRVAWAPGASTAQRHRASAPRTRRPA